MASAPTGVAAVSEAVEEITARATIDLNQALLAFRRGETSRARSNYSAVLKSIGELVDAL